MKKLLILILMAALVSPSLMAQPSFGVGLKGGVNFATQVTPGAGEGVAVQQLIGFNAGGYGNLFIYDFLGIQAELMVSTRGSDWDDIYYNVKDLLTYIDLPLLVKFQPVRYANIHAGPQFGYLLSARQKDDETGEITNINDWYNKLDVGLAFGVEGNLPFRINVTVRYVLGLVSATNDVEYIDPWKNNFLQISLGFRLIGDK
jgi:hypothetical protein